MVRFLIIGIVIAVAFTLYSIVDAAMTDRSRARGVSKSVWVVLVVVLPVVGGILWFVIGKGAAKPAAQRCAPDDDPRFTGTRLSAGDLDAHMQELEDRLRELDTEVFPGEEGAGSAPSATAAPDAGAGTGTSTGTSADIGADADAETPNPDKPGATTPGTDRSNTDQAGGDSGKDGDSGAATQ